MRLGTLTLVLLICAAAVPSRAGEAAPAREWNWSISGFVGGISGGPTQDMEDAMTRSGFDARSPGFGGPGIPHPFSKTDGVSRWVLASRRIDGPSSLGVLYGRSDLGYTSGYHELAQGLPVDFRVDVFALVVSLNDRSMLQSLLQEELFELTLGVGPALYLTRTRNIDSNSSQTSNVTKFGLLFDVGLRAPANRRFFLLGDVQYRLAGSAAVGPFTAESRLPSGETATLPKTHINISHFSFGVGVGIRL